MVPDVELTEPRRLGLVPCHVEGALSTLGLEEGLFWKRRPRSPGRGVGFSKLRLLPRRLIRPWASVCGAELLPGVQCKPRSTPTGRRDTTGPEAVCVRLAPESQGVGAGEGCSGNAPPTARRTERNNDGPLAN